MTLKCSRISLASDTLNSDPSFARSTASPSSPSTTARTPQEYQAGTPSSSSHWDAEGAPAASQGWGSGPRRPSPTAASRPLGQGQKGGRGAQGQGTGSRASLAAHASLPGPHQHDVSSRGRCPSTAGGDVISTWGAGDGAQGPPGGPPGCPRAEQQPGCSGGGLPAAAAVPVAGSPGTGRRAPWWPWCTRPPSPWGSEGCSPAQIGQGSGLCMKSKPGETASLEDQLRRYRYKV